MAKPTSTRPWANKWHRSILVLGLAAGTAFAGGWLVALGTSPQAAAQTVKPGTPPAPLPPSIDPDYSRRVVARIYGNIEITREELGEYLIARMGGERLELLVNRKIIEKACADKGITVTPAEVEAALIDDCGKLGIDRKVFLDQVLKQYKKTLYEWKEDVLRPRLLLGKLCRDRVVVSDDEIHQEFEAQYGEKVDVRVLLYPKEQRSVLMQIYQQVRGNDQAFMSAARNQPNAQLAMKAGEVQPISHYSGEETIEKVAFSLQPGELSEVVETAMGQLIMKCVKRMPPDRTKIFENERDALKKVVEEKKMQKEVGKIFEELKKEAQPKILLEHKETMAELDRAVHEELNAGPAPLKNAIQRTSATQEKK
jgi:hypothetical protein